jgi:SAM-dependent methyltransferase
MGIGAWVRIANAHFEARYHESDDPWDLQNRWYEQRKHALTVAMLPQRRYGRAFEPGCATGLLTLLLAPRCKELVAMDAAATAVRLAQRRCADHPNVRVEHGGIPEDWPPGGFDLTVLSEVGYYLDPDSLEAVIDRCARSGSGDMIAVHYRPPAQEHLWTGDEVHAHLRQHRGLRHMASYAEPSVLCDVFRYGDDRE